MTNLPFLRFFNLKRPVETLTNKQRKALDIFNEKLKKQVYTFEEVPCLCGKFDGKLIANYDRYALPANTYLCRTCSVMWTNPRMTEVCLNKFYEDDYRPIYVGFSEAPDNFLLNQVQHGRRIHKFIRSNIIAEHELKVFDVGCGAGGILIPFLESGWSTFGCDVGEEYLLRGRDEGLVLEHGDAETLTKYGPTNLIILSHVLEHFPQPLMSLKQMANLLIDDGYIYIEVPGIFNIHNTYGDTMLFLQNAHLYHFTLETLTTLMAKAGYKLVKGDKSIRALFQKDKNLKNTLPRNEYKKILLYLYMVEFGRIFLLLSLLRIINTTKNRAFRITMRIRKLILNKCNNE